MFLFPYTSKGSPNWQSVSLEQVSGWISSFTRMDMQWPVFPANFLPCGCLPAILIGEGKLTNDFTELISNPKKGSLFT